MAVFVVSHKVNDFGVWKSAFDSHSATREKFGIKEHFILQGTDDPNSVTVVGEGELGKIQEFLNSEELKSATRENKLWEDIRKTL